jgi:hypothetical protein
MTVNEVCLRVGMPWLYNPDADRGRIMRELILSEALDAISMKFGKYIVIAGGVCFRRVRRTIRPRETDVDMFTLNPSSNPDCVGYDHNHEPLQQVFGALSYMLSAPMSTMINNRTFTEGGQVYNWNQEKGDSTVIIDKYYYSKHEIKVHPDFTERVHESRYWAENSAEASNSLKNAGDLHSAINTILAGTTSDDMHIKSFGRVVVSCVKIGVKFDVISNQLVHTTSSWKNPAAQLPLSPFEIIKHFDLSVCQIFVSSFERDHRANTVCESICGLLPGTLAELRADPPILRLTPYSIQHQAPNIIFDLKRFHKYIEKGCRFENTPISICEMNHAVAVWHATGRYNRQRVPNPVNRAERVQFDRNNQRNVYKLLLRAESFSDVLTALQLGIDDFNIPIDC